MQHASCSSRHIGLCLAFAIATSLGCHTSGAPGKTDSGLATTTVDVQNQSFNDMTVHVLVNGQRVRLGVAPGNKTTVLTIPRYLLAGNSYLRFVCDPIAGDRTPVTEEINVSPGDQLVLVINPGG